MALSLTLTPEELQTLEAAHPPPSRYVLGSGDRARQFPERCRALRRTMLPNQHTVLAGSWLLVSFIVD